MHARYPRRLRATVAALTLATAGLFVPLQIHAWHVGTVPAHADIWPNAPVLPDPIPTPDPSATSDPSGSGDPTVTPCPVPPDASASNGDGFAYGLANGNASDNGNGNVYGSDNGNAFAYGNGTAADPVSDVTTSCDAGAAPPDQAPPAPAPTPDPGATDPGTGPLEVWPNPL